MHTSMSLHFDMIVSWVKLDGISRNQAIIEWISTSCSLSPVSLCDVVLSAEKCFQECLTTVDKRMGL